MKISELEKYKNEGLIEAYCLGTLDDVTARAITTMAKTNIELRSEIDKTIHALSLIRNENLSNDIRMKVLSTLDEMMEAAVIDLANPPLINYYSDANAWSKSLENIKETEIVEGIGLHVIIEKEDVQLNVVWLYDTLTEEGHDDSAFSESFLILEGRCECDFEGRIFQFSAGDYFDIPVNTRHIIKNISTELPYVKGLVQRKRLAV